MKAITKLAIAGAGVVALAAEVAIHGYLDVMYVEKIPKGLIKRAMLHEDDPVTQRFRKFTRESCDWIGQQDIENIDMQSKRGYNVKGYLLLAEKPSNTFVVFAHGYRSTHLGDPANFEQFYHEKGYHFLSMDHVAAGESGGKFVGFDYYESDDLLSWVDYLVDRFGTDINIILHGVSMGGATVCQCASRVPEQVKLIISDCAYTGAIEQFHSVVNSVGIKKAAPALVNLFNAINKRVAGYDLADTDVLDSVGNSKVPMMFVHGDADDFVPTSMVYTLYDACKNDKKLLIVKGAVHAQSIMTGGDQYKAEINDFINKYM